MLLTVFEHTYWLQALGGAIANSFWQGGLFWYLYKLLSVSDKKMSSILKHHIGLALMLASLLWFVVTFIRNYLALTSEETSPGLPVTNTVWTGLQFTNTVLPLLSITYLTLLFCQTAGFLKHLTGNRILQTTGLSKAPIDIRLYVTNTSLHLGIKKKVHVWLSEHIDVPCITGFLKPVILLPIGMLNQLTTQQVESILLHELAHIKRNDYLLNIIQSIVDTLLFFNPFALLLSKSVRKERENCCDEWVLTFRYSRYDYAHALLLLEEQRQQKHSLRFALASSTGQKDLLKRVKHLFDTTPQTSITSLQKLRLAVIYLLLLPFLIVLLPGIVNSPAGQELSVSNNKSNNMVIPRALKVGNNYSESRNSTIAISPTRFSSEKKNARVKEKSSKRPAYKETENDNVSTFINDELIEPGNQPEPTFTQVVEKDTSGEATYYVRVEEEQSGKMQTNTYLFELSKKNDGNTEIKPLIIVNKKLTDKKLKKSVSDSLNLTPEKRKLRTKRITS